MNYNEFKNNVQEWPIIFSRDLILHQINKQIILNQLERWCAKKLLFKLKRGVFLLNPADRKITPSRTYIANQLYSPSYVSLEYALGYYDLIPERVTDITSVTTKKTLRVKNELGNFSYQHVKTETFRGFRALKDDAGLVFLIAEPEKAIVDFCYLNMERFQGDYKSILEESYRFQNVERLNAEKITAFSRLFNNRKLMRISKALCSFIKEERSKR